MSNTFNISDDFTLSVLFETLLLTKYGWNNEYNNKDCAICLESLKNKHSLTTNCEHSFCRNCILANIMIYERINCPCCPIIINKLNKSNK
jgi:hypothetical protein